MEECHRSWGPWWDKGWLLLKDYLGEEKEMGKEEEEEKIVQCKVHHRRLQLQ